MPQRFVAYVVCPRCQRSGAAVWEESEEPVWQRGGEWGTTITRVSEGFAPGRTGQIFCAGCDVKVVVRQGKQER
jgi:uncharacterized Zn finger protein (UPF0148 family)